MKTSNTRIITALYMSAGPGVPLHIAGQVRGKVTRICSLPARLNNYNMPEAREMRGILEGRSIVEACNEGG